MATYAVHYSYGDDTDARMAARPAHRDFLDGLAGQGVCLVAGAYAPSEAPGGLLIFRADSKDQVSELLRDDPYQRGGFVTETKILEWGPVIGPYAEGLH